MSYKVGSQVYPVWVLSSAIWAVTLQSQALSLQVTKHGWNVSCNFATLVVTAKEQCGSLTVSSKQVHILFRVCWFLTSSVFVLSFLRVSAFDVQNMDAQCTTNVCSSFFSVLRCWESRVSILLRCLAVATVIDWRRTRRRIGELNNQPSVTLDKHFLTSALVPTPNQHFALRERPAQPARLRQICRAPDCGQCLLLVPPSSWHQSARNDASQRKFRVGASRRVEHFRRRDHTVGERPFEDGRCTSKLRIRFHQQRAQPHKDRSKVL